MNAESFLNLLTIIEKLANNMYLISKNKFKIDRNLKLLRHLYDVSNSW